MSKSSAFTSQSSGNGPGPLSGITVIDMTRVLAGPYCTMVLSDMGARVIKVESPNGDDSRTFGPWVDGQSAYFMSLNRGKESIALDLKADAERIIFEALLDRADVLIENFRPGVMGRLGYNWEILEKRYPRLIFASVSGFGQTGPLANRPAYDMVVQGMGGIMSLTGHEGGPPTRVGTAIGDITAGMFTAIAVNGALFERGKTGRGQHIDIAMLDCQLAILENAIARTFAFGTPPGPSAARHPSIAPFECYASSDGHIIIAAGNDGLYATLCETLGAPGLIEDARFKTNDERIANVHDLRTEIEQRLADDTTEGWLARLEAAGVPCGPLNDVAQAISQPQTRARNMVVGIDGLPRDRVGISGNPIKLSRHDDPETRGPVPELDGHRARILAELGMSEHGLGDPDN